MKELELLLDGHHGVYIPQLFAQYYGDKLKGQQPDISLDIDTLLAGPDGEFYWEAWEGILDGEYLDDNGNKFTLYQSGDLWLVPDGYEGEYPE